MHSNVIPVEKDMPDVGDVLAFQEIVEQQQSVQVVVAICLNNRPLEADALRADVVYRLLKDLGLDRLARAIRSASAGQEHSSPVTERAKANATADSPPARRTLTDREREVLGLVVAGLSNQQIAKKLCVSQSTARFHVSTILLKLEAANRAEAAALAVRSGLVP